MLRVKPVLAMDVDGCINRLYLSDEEVVSSGLRVHEATAQDGHSYRLHIDPRLGSWLAELSEVYELLWCTTWGSAANTSISPLLGLPTDLRVIWLPSEWIDVPFSLCRKTAFVRRWGAENHVQRLAWFDDEVTDADAEALTRDSSGVTPAHGWERAFVDTPPLSEALTIQCDPQTGLTHKQVTTLTEWARQDG